MGANTQASKSETVRVAVIGCGQWGQNHVRVFGTLPRCEVAMAVDSDLDRLTRLREFHRHVRGEGDYRRALEDPEVNAVVIATPTKTHYELTRAALLAGKHVLCEKPLCESSQEAAELAELARSSGLVLMVGHVFLFNTGIIALKELIEKHELGELQYLSAVRTNLGPVRSDVNAAYDLASHDISIFNWLLESEPESVSATGAVYLQTGVEDVASIALKYPNNVLGMIYVSWLDPRKTRQITMVGNRRMATWDDLQISAPVTIYDKGVHVARQYQSYGEFLKLSMWDGEVRLPKITPFEPLRLQAESFLESLRTGRLNRSDGSFALGVVKALEAVNQSLKNNGSLVATR